MNITQLKKVVKVQEERIMELEARVSNPGGYKEQLHSAQIAAQHLSQLLADVKGRGQELEQRTNEYVQSLVQIASGNGGLHGHENAIRVFAAERLGAIGALPLRSLNIKA